MARPWLRRIDGSIGRSFANDFYYRIRIIERKIDVGSVAGSVASQFHVWNAFFNVRNLAQIIETDTEGLSLSGPASGDFQGLQWQLYDLAIVIDGPSDIEAIFEWDFGADSALLEVVGTRVIVIHFPALDNISETLEWRTDVLKAFATESRRGVRQTPTQAIDYSVHVVAGERQQLEKSLERQTAAFGVPIWYEAQTVPSITAGAVTIDVDTTVSDYRVNGLLFIFKDTANFESATITGISDTQITLKGATGNSYTAAQVMPMRIAYIASANIDRLHIDNNIVNMSFVVREYAAIAAGAFTQYEGSDVLLDPTVTLRSQKVSINQSRQWLDNGIGGMKPRRNESRSRILDSHEWVTSTIADKWVLRQWLFSRAGQRNAFYVPTFQNDYRLISSFAALDTSIQVSTSGEVAPFDIFVKLQDGSTFLRRITQVVPDAILAQEAWTFAVGFGVDVAVADIRLFSRVRFMRQTADRVELKHSAPLITQLNVPLTTV